MGILASKVNMAFVNNAVDVDFRVELDMSTADPNYLVFNDTQVGLGENVFAFIKENLGEVFNMTAYNEASKIDIFNNKASIGKDIITPKFMVAEIGKLYEPIFLALEKADLNTDLLVALIEKPRTSVNDLKKLFKMDLTYTMPLEFFAALFVRNVKIMNGKIVGIGALENEEAMDIRFDFLSKFKYSKATEFEKGVALAGIHRFVTAFAPQMQKNCIYQKAIDNVLEATTKEITKVENFSGKTLFVSTTGTDLVKINETYKIVQSAVNKKVPGRIVVNKDDKASTETGIFDPKLIDVPEEGYMIDGVAFNPEDLPVAEFFHLYMFYTEKFIEKNKAKIDPSIEAGTIAYLGTVLFKEGDNIQTTLATSSAAFVPTREQFEKLLAAGKIEDLQLEKDYTNVTDPVSKEEIENVIKLKSNQIAYLMGNYYQIESAEFEDFSLLLRPTITSKVALAMRDYTLRKKILLIDEVYGDESKFVVFI